MKKSLIALAVAGAFAAPVAMAETTIYGAANMSLDFTDNGDVSANKVTSNASAIGFKGSEDLGGGTSAVWQIESAVNLDTGGGVLGTNNSYAGLSGSDWGTVLLGNHDTPYKLASRSLDLFADGIADNRTLMGQTGGGAANHDARLGNVLAYISPAMGGVTIAAAYVAAAEGASVSGQSKGSAYSLAALYGAGPLAVNFGYQTMKGGSPGATLIMPKDEDATAWKLGGSYTMDAFQVVAVYEKLSGTAPIVGSTFGGKLDQSNWYIGGKYYLGSDAVKVAYTSAGKINSTNDTNANQLSVGYDHSMSKNTTVYALYTKLNNSNAGNYTLGFTADASSDAVVPSAPGKDPSAWSIGIKHSF